jgi:CheY-like chemotaxis protein
LEDEMWLVEMGELIIRARFSKVDLVNFTNGDDAWRDLCREEPDLFMTDCCHPGLDVVEIMRRVTKQKARFPIIWSGYPPRELYEQLYKEEKSLRSLGVLFLPKPYTVNELLEQLNGIFGPCDKACFQQGQECLLKEVCARSEQSLAPPRSNKSGAV